MTTRNRRCIAACGAVAALFCLAATKPPAYPEQEVKAAFLVKFAYFVEWPDHAFQNPGAPVIITVLGKDPFGSALDEMAEGKTVKGRRIIIERTKRFKLEGPCHILYISDSERENVDDYLDAISQMSMLTVSDIPGFCARGGMLEFFRADNKVAILGNFAAASDMGVKLSSKLMRVIEAYTKRDVTKDESHANAA